MESVTEVWRKVPGFDFYEVSDHGRVRSVDRTVIATRHGKQHEVHRRGKMLRPMLSHGYQVVKLGHPDNSRGIHRIVAWAFIGPQIDGKVVNHIDGNKLNNTPANLEYITNSENVDHAYRTGLLSNKGSTNGKAILTEERAREIIDLLQVMRPSPVSRKLGVPLHVVQQISVGKTWKHIPRPTKEVALCS